MCVIGGDTGHELSQALASHSPEKPQEDEKHDGDRGEDDEVDELPLTEDHFLSHLPKSAIVLCLFERSCMNLHI